MNKKLGFKKKKYDYREERKILMDRASRAQVYYILDHWDELQEKSDEKMRLQEQKIEEFKAKWKKRIFRK